ncbi:MAG TPA: BrnA antitoxin family protein [Xanthomonadales bacterium]|nr:BrnA antitoxin family protein [Xanthomonadales bacterium]
MSKKSKTERNRLPRAPGVEVVVDDIPELDEAFFRTAEWRPPIKQPLTIRIDADVLEWFRSRGRGYQTQINRLLRRYMEINKEPG